MDLNRQEFSCKQECGSNCCGYVIIKSLALNNGEIDGKYLGLRDIEYKEIIINKDLKYIYFKIPIKCKWLKDNKCINYENRPLACKVNASGKFDNPFRIKDCPYDK